VNCRKWKIEAARAAWACPPAGPSSRAAASAGDGRKQALLAALTAYLIDELRAHGSRLTHDQAVDVWGLDIELNAQGLEVWLDGAAA